MIKNEHLGSDFDEFLATENLLTEVNAIAIKRVIAYQIAQAMLKDGLSKSAMAQKMNTSRSSLDRLLPQFEIIFRLNRSNNMKI